MARSFSRRDARRLIAEHQGIKHCLKDIRQLEKDFRSDIVSSADRMVFSEVLEVLKGVPIEELNRDRLGIRTGLLKENGYQTVADIAAASVYEIASIHGIGSQSAYTIRRVAEQILGRARQNTKIRLSLDEKTREATKLVTTVSAYIRLSPVLEAASKLEKTYDTEIANAIADLTSSTKGLRWLFSSRKTREGREDACRYLEQMLDGEYGQVAKMLPDRRNYLLHLPPDQAWEDFSRDSIPFFKVLEDVVPGVLGNSDTLYGLPEELAAQIRDEAFFPDGLLCTLRNYQVWGVKYILHQERVLLGDEMGLGKTVQAIASMVSLKNTGATHFIVVCPASVITNWCREIVKMSRLRVTKVHGPDRDLALLSWIRTGGVAVTTYETTDSFFLPDSFRCSMLIVDEAHYIKNPGTKRTMNVTGLSNRADRLLFMTGTALENRVGEMVSLIRILQPEIADKVRGMEFLSSAPQFRQLVAPVYYRRKREDVLTELPEKTEEKEWCTLLPEEEAVYEQAVLSGYYAGARRVSWSVEDLHNSSKARRMLEIIEEAESEERKVIVFSFFLDTIRKVCSLLGDRCMEPINGSVPPARRQEILDRFEKAPAGSVLAAQILSGGTGLNIQTASVVILCEPQFKPSVENQAISRAYRMGQTRNVLVFRLLCENTVDEKITEMLEQKQAVFDAFADKSEAARGSLELDEKTFGDIIQSEIERIKAKNEAIQTDRQ